MAAAVTVYARIYMRACAVATQPQYKNKALSSASTTSPSLYYSDTVPAVSCYFDGPLPNNYISSTRLGALKLEGLA